MFNEKVNQLGTSFNYTWYFEKRRNKLFNRQKKHAKEFTEKLDIAILVSVRMTGGEIGKKLDLRQMSKNQQCTVCHSFVSEKDKDFTHYFRATKVDGENRPAGFNLEWTREKLNSAEQLNETEWLSGPLLLCKDCVNNVSWCEFHIKLKELEHNMQTSNFDQLPKICSLYNSLEKTLNLGTFFEEQINLLLNDPKKNIVQLVELRNSVENTITGINSMSLQISKIGYNDPTFSKTNRRELIIQRNICQHSIDVSWKLRHLVSSINSVYDKISAENNSVKVQEQWSILNEVRRLLCLPVRRVDYWAAVTWNNNNNSIM